MWLKKEVFLQRGRADVSASKLSVTSPENTADKTVTFDFVIVSRAWLPSVRRTFVFFRDFCFFCHFSGSGNAYAFVRFLILDMAYKAKCALQGARIGNYPCKIGYGKTNPTTRVWVGNLTYPGTASDLDESRLFDEFDRFGPIKKVSCCPWICWDRSDQLVSFIPANILICFNIDYSSSWIVFVLGLLPVNDFCEINRSGNCWMMEISCGRLIDWLIGCLFFVSFDWLIGWLAYIVVIWLIYWMQIHWPLMRALDWLIDWMLIHWPLIRLLAWLIDWLPRGSFFCVL